MTDDSRLSTVLITGAAGQLGSDLVKVVGEDYQTIPASSADFDVKKFEAAMEFIKNAKPDVIIHAAAFTDVDGCESQQDKAFTVNGLGTRNVALAAREVNAKLFYISTDYVFDGTKEGPYLEFDRPNPINVYGRSKLWGEEFVREQLHKFFIIRTAWLYGRNGKNFVKTMLKLAKEKEELQVVNDQRGTPTHTKDLARQIKELIPTELYGTYHCTSQGSCTWYEFALEIFKSASYATEVAPNGSTHLIPNPKSLLPALSSLIPNPESLSPNTQDLTPITLRPVTSAEFLQPAKRPKNSVLDNYLLRLQGLDIMPPWEESLKKFMKEVKREVLV